MRCLLLLVVPATTGFVHHCAAPSNLVTSTRQQPRHSEKIACAGRSGDGEEDERLVSATKRGTAKLAVAGDLSEDVARRIAARYGAETVFLEDVMRGRRGPRTDKSTAAAVAKRIHETEPRGWVLGGFPQTALQAELLEEVHKIRIDRLVVGIQGEGDASEPVVDGHELTAASGSDEAEAEDTRLTALAGLMNMFEDRLVEVLVEPEPEAVARTVAGLLEFDGYGEESSQIPQEDEESDVAESCRQESGGDDGVGAAADDVAADTLATPAPSRKDIAKQRALEGALQRQQFKERRKSIVAASAPARDDDLDEVRLPFYARFVKGAGAAARRSTASSAEVAAVPQLVPAPAAGNLTLPLRFGALRLQRSAALRLYSLGIVEPSPIQEAAMVRIAAGESLILHAATGSGKTLAFLLPLMLAKSGKTFIVAPTRELCVQIAREATLLAGAKASAVDVLASAPPPPLASLRAPLVVGTAKLFATAAAEASPATLTAVKRVVLDEVDRLLDPPPSRAGARASDKARQRHVRPAAEFLQRLVRAHRSGDGSSSSRSSSSSGVNGEATAKKRQSPSLQVVACSATVGRPLRRELARLLGAEDYSEGPAVVRADEQASGDAAGAAGESDEGSASPVGRAVTVPAGIRHFYLPLREGEELTRITALISLLRELRPRAALVLAPPGSRVEALVAALRSEGFRGAIALHEALGFISGRDGSATASQSMSLHDQLSAAFTRSAADASDESSASFGSQGTDAAAPIVVTSTDSARGLHFDAIDYVFLLCRAGGPDEYLHLAGRTGRSNSTGTAVSLVTYREARAMRAWEAALGIRFEEMTGEPEGGTGEQMIQTEDGEDLALPLQ